MRRFGRQCRGMGKVLVTLVRQTETQLLEMGQQVLPLARAAQECLHGAPQLSQDQRARLDTQLAAALEAHHRIESQSRRLTQGKALGHCKIVNAYDPTIAPICKGKSNCPALELGRGSRRFVWLSVLLICVRGCARGRLGRCRRLCLGRRGH